MITHIAQIGLTVRDLSRSREFYQHKLGLTHLFDAGNMTFFQCGGVRLMLGTSPQSAPCVGAIVYFNVDDIQAAYTSLQERGVTFLQPPHVVARMPDHDLWLTLLQDPDANAVGLMAQVRT